MARLVTIQIDAAASGYTATIQKIQEQNKKLYSEAQTGTAQLAQSTKAWETSLVGMGSAITKVIGLLGGMAAVWKSINFVDQFTAFAEQLKAISQRTGVTVEDLHALERAAKADEASLEELSTAFRFLNRRISESKDPTSEAAKLFKLLGITATDTLPAFLQLADRMRDNLSIADKYRVSNELLGKGSENLINFASRGGAAILTLIEMYKQMGVVTTEAANKADELRDKWEALKETLSVTIGLPVIDWLVELGKRAGRTAEQLKEAGRWLRPSRGATGEFGAPLRGASGEWAELAPGAHTEGAIETEKNLINVGAAMAKTGDTVNKAAEALARLQDQILRANVTTAEFARTQGDMSFAVRDATFAMIAHEEAAQIAAATHDKILTPAIQEAIEKLADMKRLQFDNAEIERQRKLNLEGLKAEMDAQAKGEEMLAEARRLGAQFILDEYAKEKDKLEIDREVLELEAERLQMLGLTTEAERLRLEATLKYIEAIKKRKAEEGGDTRVEEQKIRNTQTALSRLGQVTIDIGSHVGRTLDDIFTAMIQGTLKAVDVGKAAVSTIGRIVTDIFSQTIKDKLKFELNLFNNLQQLPGQATNAVAAGGGGGILQTLLFGSNQNAQGQSGQFFSGGGGGGGIMGMLKSFLGTSLVGTSTIGSVGAAGAAGFGLSKLLGLNTGANIGSTLGGIGGSLFGGTIGGGAGTMAIASGLSSILPATIASSIASFAFPIIGTLIGAILGQVLGNVFKKNPTAITSAAFSGVNFNELTASFDPGTISVMVKRSTDISGGKANQVAGEVQTILATQANKWTALLNLFPETIRESLIPALDGTNAALNAAFARLKFSEGGSRNIAQEIQALTYPQNAPTKFLNAFLPAIRQGAAGSLAQAGIPVTGGLNVSAPFFTQEGLDKLTDDITKLIGITGQLATITEQGIKPFLTDLDVDALSAQFSAVFSAVGPEAFGKAMEGLEENIAPFIEYLNSALKQATDLFGRGIIAAMEAATEDDAVLQFHTAMNQGIYQAVSSGIVEALIATAQFNDLLAPLQKAIRESVQNSITTGMFDSGAFQQAVLPAIESILSRAELLDPMIKVLQQFSSTLKDILGLNPLVEAITEPLAAGLTESATIFGQSLIAVMNDVSGSPLDTFAKSFNTAIKDAIFSGIVESFLAAGFVDTLLDPLTDAINAAITQSRETGAFIAPDLGGIIGGLAGTGEAWKPLLDFLGEMSRQIIDALGLTEPGAAPLPTTQHVNITVSGAGNPEETARAIAKILRGGLPPQ